jgi:hypothetical protein
MRFFRRNKRDIKNSKAQSGSGHDRDPQARQSDEQNQRRDGGDMVMEQGKDVPLGKQKADGSGERR